MFGILLLALAIGQIVALDENRFKETLANECFKNGNFEWKPKSAVSMDNFIYIVEKLEEKSEISAQDLIRSFFDEFSCSGLTTENNKWERIPRAIAREDVVDIFLKDDVKNNVPNITGDDRCQLFFMLSQSEQEIKSENTFYEHGVVSLSDDSERAIDISKVLTGILAGLNRKEKSFQEFITGPRLEDYYNWKLNNLYSFTIAETISALATYNKLNGEEGSKGTWTSTSCPKSYICNGKTSESLSLAEIIGAVDGFILGSKIDDMPDKNDIKLSQMLRMYYTQEGFKDNSADQKSVSYCTRSNIADDLKQVNLTEKVLPYAIVYLKIVNKLNQDNENAVIDKIKNFPSSIQTFLKKTEAEERACSDPPPEKKDTCETLSNIVVILDKRSESNFTKQKEITGTLINQLNIGLHEDNITVYVNAATGELEKLVKVSDSKAIASCTLDDADRNDILPSAEDSKVLEEIKNILSEYENERKSLPAIPSKVVVYFNFKDDETSPKEVTELTKATRQLRTSHPDAALFPIGSNKEYLEKYFSNEQPSAVFLWHDESLIPDLKTKICEVPAIFQYENCKTKSTFKDSMYTGYIKENHVQHWVMFPKYFLKSFHYEFQFKPENGQIRVCFSRNGPITDPSVSASVADCRTTENSDNKNIIQFKFHDPCKDRTVYTCKPLYFSVFGRGDELSQRCSSDETNGKRGCKTLTEIKYTAKHEGISCNSAKQLISMPFFQALLAFAITFYILTWQK